MIRYLVVGSTQNRLSKIERGWQAMTTVAIYSY